MAHEISATTGGLADKIAKYKKFVVSALTFVVAVGTAILQTTDVLPDSYTPVITSVVTGASALLVLLLRNKPLQAGDKGYVGNAIGAGDDL